MDTGKTLFHLYSTRSNDICMMSASVLSDRMEHLFACLFSPITSAEFKELGDSKGC